MRPIMPVIRYQRRPGVSYPLSVTTEIEAEAANKLGLSVACGAESFSNHHGSGSGQTNLKHKSTTTIAILYTKTDSCYLE